MNQTLDPKVFGKFAELFYLRPTCKNIEITPKMAAKGITNTADLIRGSGSPTTSGISITPTKSRRRSTPSSRRNRPGRHTAQKGVR